MRLLRGPIVLLVVLAVAGARTASLACATPAPAAAAAEGHAHHGPTVPESGPPQHESADGPCDLMGVCALTVAIVAHAQVPTNTYGEDAPAPGARAAAASLSFLPDPPPPRSLLT